MKWVRIKEHMTDIEYIFRFSDIDFIVNEPDSIVTIFHFKNGKKLRSYRLQQNTIAWLLEKDK